MTSSKPSAKDLLIQAYKYCMHGVWHVEGGGHLNKIVRAANLAVRCFLNKEVQERACSLTYRTILSLVPALAMLFAIARGFGFQKLVHGQLMGYFPAQQEALEMAMQFVDSYLQHASSGAFVGIGLLMLVYTLVNLMSSVETAFNKIWGITVDRPLYRKITDYTALFLFIPVFLICSAGLSIFFSEMMQRVTPVDVSPVVERMLKMMPVLPVWFMFTFAFWIVPHTKVRFRYALISGVIFGSLYFVLQWVFIASQMMVSSYNAIYGSFAFLPLLLFWMQLSWMLVLMGNLMTYALQNIYGFNYTHHDDIGSISQAYMDELTIMSLALIARRFQSDQAPISKQDLSGEGYNIPIVLVDSVLKRLLDTHLIYRVVVDEYTEAYQPAFALELLTLDEVRTRLSHLGSNRFLTAADGKFAQGYAMIKDAPGTTLITQLLD